MLLCIGLRWEYRKILSKDKSPFSQVSLPPGDSYKGPMVEMDRGGQDWYFNVWVNPSSGLFPMTLSPVHSHNGICHECLDDSIVLPIYNIPKVLLKKQNFLQRNPDTTPNSKHQACNLADLQAEHLGHSGCCQWLKDCTSIWGQPTQSLKGQFAST